ncbi:MAG: ABC transporter [Tepidisphaera sp.]|nr:ABC transporter [Tepidisphaera sp.]
MLRSLQIPLLFTALLVLFLGVNMLAGAGLRGVRVDATEGSIYTLTKGSRNIARSPEEPIKLTLYYTSKLAQGRPEIQSFAQRVRETLEEYARVSNGKIKLSVINPEPFSQEEDDATQAGLTPVPINEAGENLYLGLVGTNSTDGKEVIPFFDPRKERFLEYDVSRLVYSLANPKKPVVGIISSIALDGGFTMNPRTRQPEQTPPWAISEEIKSLYQVRTLNDAKEIPDDITVLMIVHPQNLSDQTLFAIDQYVMRGGHVLLFTDPYCENDKSPGPMGMGSGGGSSSLAKILDAWGVQMTPGKLAADKDLALRVYVGQRGSQEPVPYIVWLNLNEKTFAKEDAVTSNLKQLIFATSGVIEPKKDFKDGATITPLVHTTTSGGVLPTEALGFPPDPKALLKQYTPGNIELTLAARLSGKVKSAFPDGPPKPPEGQEAPPAPKEVLKESKGSINVIYVVDCDMLADNMWTRSENFFGQQVQRKISDNADFVLSALDNLTGNDDLISIRARREAARPFDTVDEMQRRADQTLLSQQAVLEEKLKDTQKHIEELQRARDDKGALTLTAEQAKEIAKFKADYADTRKKLRQVRLDLNKDIEHLGTLLKIINTAMMPVLVAAFALLLYLFRRARRAVAATSAQAHTSGGAS